MDPKWTSGNELKYLKQVLDNEKEDLKVIKKLIAKQNASKQQNIYYC